MQENKLGFFDVDAEGNLSLNGQKFFPMYALDGGLSFEFVSYQLTGTEVKQIITRCTYLAPELDRTTNGVKLVRKLARLI